MKIATIIGARPQFIKASAINRAIDDHNNTCKQHIEEVVIHTGQHYDENMSEVFFSQLNMRAPRYNLEISRCSHGEMTGRMLISIEQVLRQENPDCVLVYGDTNSTLAGALAAVKLHFPIVHVEAGLRSYNRRMPEEINRAVTDCISTLLFCPTDDAVTNLAKEGITNGVFNVGDVMYDSALFYKEKAGKSVDLQQWGVAEGEYVLCTVHRSENTDDCDKLTNIIKAIKEIAKSIPVIFPVHPRTGNKLESLFAMEDLPGVNLIAPVSYLDMTALESAAKVIVTDSGGVQKEAFFHNKPCLTLREETEWLETVAEGANTLCGTDCNRIIDAWNRVQGQQFNWKRRPYGDGTASRKIVKHIIEFFETAKEYAG